MVAYLENFHSQFQLFCLEGIYILLLQNINDPSLSILHNDLHYFLKTFGMLLHPDTEYNLNTIICKLRLKIKWFYMKDYKNSKQNLECNQKNINLALNNLKLNLITCCHTMNISINFIENKLYNHNNGSKK